MKYTLFIALGLCLAWPAYAQVSPSDEPGREAERFEQPSRPLAERGGTIRLPGVVAPEGAGTISLRVIAITFAGGSVYAERELSDLYAELLDREITLSELYDLAQRITAKYGEDGYVLSRAIIPPQELDPAGAVVTIQLVEGYIDRVEWPPEVDRYRDFFSEYASKITAERPTNINSVMRYLLLAGDLPRIDVTSQFRASETNPDASTLVVGMTEKPVDAYAQFDNRGTEARGPIQYSVSGTLNNILGVHEALTVTTSGTIEVEELQRVALRYKQVLTSEGVSGFANASYSRGTPGTAPLQALEFQTESISLDAGFAVPVIRHREHNLTLSALAFLSDNKGWMLGAPSSDDRLRGIRVLADFDIADEMRGVTQGNVTFSQGLEAFGSTTNSNPLASRENGRVDFTKVEGSLSRVQEFDAGLSVLVAASGQYAFTPLLSSEECGYGGRDFGRAFDPAEISGDSCLSVSGEMRFDPDFPDGDLKLVQFYAFADYGHVYRIAPSLGTPTEQHGASAGVGVRLGSDNFSADLSATKPLLGRLDDGWRFFLTTTAKY